MKKFNIGIIGCGAVVQKNHIPSLSLYSNFTVTHVYDLNVDMAEIVAKKTNARIATLEEVGKNCDVILIATPPATHFNLIVKLIKYDKIIICEKPFLPCESELNAVNELKEMNFSSIYVTHFRRLFPSVKLAKSMIDLGILGKVESITAYEGGHFTWETKSDYVYKDPYGGVLFDTGSHLIDMFLYITGLDEKKLHYKVLNVEKKSDEPTHILAANFLIYDSNDEINIKLALSRLSSLSNKIKINCQNGYIELPTDLADFVKIGRNGLKPIILQSKEKGVDIMDCFAQQYNHMVNNNDGLFCSNRFLNLTIILEKLSQFKGA